MKTIPLTFLILIFFAVGTGCSLFLGAHLSFDPLVFFELRVPRTILGIAVGGGLSVAGAMIQSLTGNPLADAYTMGIASAATLGAIISMNIFHSPYLAPLFSFLFSIGYLIILIYWIKPKIFSIKDLILTGVISGFFFSSLTTLVLAVSDPHNWFLSVSWILGSLRSTDLQWSLVCLASVVFVTALCWLIWKPLDLLSIDTDLALSSGVDVKKYRLYILVLCSLLTAVCVSSAGTVGFVGLIVPHVIRKLKVQSHRFLLPLTFLAGAALITFSDGLARIVARPSELPVGVIMSLLGGPFLLYIVRNLK